MSSSLRFYRTGRGSESEPGTRGRAPRPEANLAPAAKEGQAAAAATAVALVFARLQLVCADLLLQLDHALLRKGQLRVERALFLLASGEFGVAAPELALGVVGLHGRGMQFRA